ncbi:hypothetical protein WKW77_04430 [Variovorax ureilyticus]|uniref:DUF4410 domain-containing protein n=1 Tax=Variovorax ureilyticus TaxID=1836198 RepID=A0ABU8VAF4_9BURK
MRLVLRFAMLAAIVALAGCAANVQRQGDTQKLTLSPVAAKRVALDVQGGKELLAESTDWTQFQKEWQVGMKEATTAAGMTLVPMDAAMAPNAEATTLVTVNIKDYRYVTRGSRIAVGMMTGNAWIDADVSFSELPGATPAGRRKYLTTSSAMQGIAAPMTETQIRGICDEIMKDVAQK